MAFCEILEQFNNLLLGTFKVKIPSNLAAVRPTTTYCDVISFYGYFMESLSAARRDAEIPRHKEYYGCSVCSESLLYRNGTSVASIAYANLFYGQESLSYPIQNSGGFQPTLVEKFMELGC